MAALQAAGEKAPDGVSLEIADLSGIPTYNDEAYQDGFPTAVETPRGRLTKPTQFCSQRRSKITPCRAP